MRDYLSHSLFFLLYRALTKVVPPAQNCCFRARTRLKTACPTLPTIFERLRFVVVVVVVVVVVLTLTRIIKSVVTGQAPVTLKLRNAPGKKHKRYLR